MALTQWQEELRRTLPAKVSKEYRDLIRAHGSSRKKAVDFICSIGGYGSRHDNYAIEWNVKCYGVNLDAPHLYHHAASQDFEHLKKLCKHDGERGVLYALFKHEVQVYGDHLWETATQEAWEGFKDDEGTFWGSDRDAEFRLTGRSGGHMVLARTCGLGLTCSTEDLEERLMEQDGCSRGEYSVRHDTVVHLFLLCVQMGVDCTRTKIEAEVEHRASWRIWASINEAELKQSLQEYNDAQGHVDLLAAVVADDDGEESISAIARILGVKDPFK